MNATVEKFGYPATLVHETRHWLVLVRPQQVTLGSLVLAAKSDATAFADLPPDAFAELHAVIAQIEGALRELSAFEKINYLMLMMVDPHVHFHVFPRYAGSRNWDGVAFDDRGWPGQPALAEAHKLTEDQIATLAANLRKLFG